MSPFSFIVYVIYICADNVLRGRAICGFYFSLLAKKIIKKKPANFNYSMWHHCEIFLSSARQCVLRWIAVVNNGKCICSPSYFKSSQASASHALMIPPQPLSLRPLTDDCAGIVLACLFCRFYDLCLMLPNSCAWAAHHLCPSYHNFAKTSEAAHNNANGDCNCNCDFDCGLFDACHETGECLELAMEISEVCYH